MLSMTIKFSIAFILSFIILSVPFSKRPLFYHLSKLTGPIGGDIKQSISKSVKRSVDKSQELGSQLFSNSEPPKIFDDRIKSKQSSILKKRRNRIKNTHLIQEELHHNEKKDLDMLIDKN